VIGISVTPNLSIVIKHLSTSARTAGRELSHTDSHSRKNLQLIDFWTNGKQRLTIGRIQGPKIEAARNDRARPHLGSVNPVTIVSLLQAARRELCFSMPPWA
jgi:hypothetical protein